MFEDIALSGGAAGICIVEPESSAVEIEQSNNDLLGFKSSTILLDNSKNTLKKLPPPVELVGEVHLLDSVYGDRLQHPPGC